MVSSTPFVHIGDVNVNTKTWKFVQISFKNHYLYSNRFANLYNTIMEMNVNKDSSAFRNLLTMLTKSTVLEHVMLCMQNYIDHYTNLIKHNDHYSLISKFVMRLTSVSLEEALVDCTQLHERMQSIGQDLQVIDFECQTRKTLDAITTAVFPAVRNAYAVMQTNITRLTTKVKDLLLIYHLEDLTMQCQKCKRGYIYHQHKDCSHKLCAKCAFQSLLKVKFCVMCKKIAKIRNREIDNIDHSDSESEYSAASVANGEQTREHDSNNVSDVDDNVNDDDDNNNFYNTECEESNDGGEDNNDDEDNDQNSRCSEDNDQNSRCSEDNDQNSRCSERNSEDNDRNSRCSAATNVAAPASSGRNSAATAVDELSHQSSRSSHQSLRSNTPIHPRSLSNDDHSNSQQIRRRPKKRVRRVDSHSHSSLRKFSKEQSSSSPSASNSRLVIDNNNVNVDENLENITKHLQSLMEKKNQIDKKIAENSSVHSNESTITHLPEDVHFNDNANDLPENSIFSCETAAAVNSIRDDVEDHDTAYAIRMSLNFDHNETLDKIINNNPNEPAPVVDNEELLNMFDELSGSNSNDRRPLTNDLQSVQEHDFAVQEHQSIVIEPLIEQQSVKVDNIVPTTTSSSKNSNITLESQLPLVDRKPIIKIEPTNMMDESVDYFQYEYPHDDGVVIKFEKENTFLVDSPYDSQSNVNHDDNHDNDDDVILVCGSSFKPKKAPVKITTFSRVVREEYNNDDDDDESSPHLPPPFKKIKLEKQ
ncbi:hypothetical protein [Alphabaculovirus altersperidaniae]|uniref:HOAR n=1 Tax=Spodoptera eridania nucleopolyhedrovirus TaxID=2315721 RepID=A0ABX6TQ52_9ABAC|nr:hypothetical protein QKS47_gp004 [Spodoptera eridania nucleopolyhedrovirus]QNV47851.1 hypothetical protein [Spodoptera eridania nucleopolyhedrovirus]